MCCMGYAALYSYAENGSAVSVHAASLNEAVRQIIRSSEDSQVLFGKKSSVISEINRLAGETSEFDWDGQGASPINLIAQQNSIGFIRALPDGIPMPEIAIEPDGFISMDWIKSRQSMFTLSIGHNDRIAFAWIDGTDSGHAVARFDQRIVPTRILDGIRATMCDESVTFRAA